MTLLKPIILATLSLATTAAFALPNTVATYNLNIGGAKGVNTQTYKQTGDHYNVSSLTKAHYWFFKDTVKEVSLGSIKGSTVRPRFYSATDTEHHTPYTLHFGFPTGKVSMRVDNKVSVVANDSMMQDHLSNALALRVATGDIVNIKVAIKNKKNKLIVKVRHYKKVGTPTIETVMGKIKTIEWVAKQKQDTLKVWVAQAHDHVVVKSQFFQKGKLKITAMVTSIK
jgi:hypothetical protein